VSSVAKLVRRATVVVGCVSLAAAAATCGGHSSEVETAATPLAVPPRPAVPAGFDTCDAFAYYQLGLGELHEHPVAAAAAFYWMQRVAPANPLGYYSERVALLLSDRRLLRGYVEEDDATLESVRVQQIDSLLLQAMDLDPFFSPSLDDELLISYFTWWMSNQIRAQVTESPHVSDQEVEAWVREWIDTRADSSERAYYAFGRGDFQQAAAIWAVQLRKDSLNTHLRAARARALYLAGTVDSAAAELATALAQARRAAAQKMRYVYDSKARWEYALGRIHELKREAAAARESYERALVEDLSFYPAHVRLAYVAAATGDTTAALTELQRALDIHGDDFSAWLYLGLLHASQRDLQPAADALRRASKIEPWAALPHLLLGNVRRDAADRAGAAAEYRRFLDLAARSDPGVAGARRRLAELSAATP